MPTYEYECKSCTHTFEVFQSMSDDPLTECPKCGKEIRRLIGGGMGIIFKGSGFYVTDNRSGSAAGNGNGSKKSQESKDSSSGSESKSTTSDNKTSDSKPSGSKQEAKSK